MTRLLILIFGLIGILSFLLPFHQYDIEINTWGHTESYSYSLSGFTETKVLVNGFEEIDESFEGIDPQEILNSYLESEEGDRGSDAMIFILIFGHLTMPFLFPLLSVFFLIIGLSNPQRRFTFFFVAALILALICAGVYVGLYTNTQMEFMGMEIGIKFSAIPHVAFFTGVLSLMMPFFISRRKSKPGLLEPRTEVPGL